jgi:hypothetical protein
MVKVIEVMLQEWLKLWKLRNEDRHGRDINTRRQAEERQALRELQQFYAANDGRVVTRLQWLFNTPLENIMEWTVGNIRIWLNAWKLIVDKSYTTSNGQISPLHHQNHYPIPTIQNPFSLVTLHLLWQWNLRIT